ncbi:fras1 related extracellular matrix protein [Plakobranchus ocellatus]|uniref:Fras1 related extracellular matrix protein n=1 Tax=Plakobranchus ocellatus TaxID=259542 RepID=A0AAV3ZJK1_9GAST|nr:fras1 related extracellular matrix protein [Plakobranchus ocellatus]
MMRLISAWVVIALVSIVYHNNKGHNSAWAEGKFSWIPKDRLDEINDHISYVLQKMNDSATFYKQPNWMYFYFSASADVNANPSVLNGSAFYFDRNCHYPNWYTTVPFNRTIPLFGPKVSRWDDYGDQDNFLREPTRTTALAFDAGAGRFMNYTHPRFKMNPW